LPDGWHPLTGSRGFDYPAVRSPSSWALGETVVALYRLRDDGYSSLKKICYGKTVVGHIFKEADGFRAVIGKIEAHSPTESEAFQRVLAQHLVQDIRARKI
jgi:hypothetical protein